MTFDVLVMVVLFLALFVIIVRAIVKYFTHTRYVNFVLRNSKSLKQIDEINSRYTFHPFVSLDQEHIYDNEDFFNDISCDDYLIYQLQFIKSKVFDQMKKMNENDRLYTEYLHEIERNVQLGQFSAPVNKLNFNKLLKIERPLADNRKQHPSTKFSLTVDLYCSTINGRIKNKKSKTFFASEIFIFSRKLNNKRGNFFNDREIWDAICRVERGKVSNKMRFSIYQRDGYRCRRCGVSGRFSQLEIDHIIPIAKGGKSTYDNLQTLCHRCNVEKGDSIENY